MPQSNDRRHEIADRLTSRAASDLEFRRRLIDDPHGAVQDELGIALPGDVTLTVLEESADQLYLVLPLTSSGDRSGQLSEAELSGVAGGASDFAWPSASPC